MNPATVARLAAGVLALRARGWWSQQPTLASVPARRFAAAAAASAPPPDATTTTDRLALGVLAGDRMSLARAITLCESTRPEHSRQAGDLLRTLIAARRRRRRASSSSPTPDATPPPPASPPRLLLPLRVAVSGPPGAGKSSLIEALGCMLADAGARVAVLAVDPTSPVSGGAILGDRCRIPRLSAHPNAFVRASPARGALGGVARATADACSLCEAAGYDTVLLETVGVGQSEVDAADMADAVVLVLPPGGAGDELQAMKRGLMEVVDVIAVNKADDSEGGGGVSGGGEAQASRTAAELRAALAAAPPGAWGLARWRGWQPRVLTVSARTGKGVDDLAGVLREFLAVVGGGEGGEEEEEEEEKEGAAAAAATACELERRRARGRERLAWSALEEACLDALRSDEGVARAMRARLRDVRAGVLPARSAAEEVLEAFRFRGRRGPAAAEATAAGS
jgi:LAO/AO transport system kinase